MHNARWMSKAIYSIKVWLFRSEFKLTKREENGLMQICHFVVTIYVRAWFSAPQVVSAPRNDLKFVQDLLRYQTVNAVVSNAAQRKFAKHLWYLGEELLGLAVFDEDLPEKDREYLVMATRFRESRAQNPKRSEEDIKYLETKSLPDLASKATQEFFRILEIDVSFFDTPVSSRKTQKSYADGKKAVGGLTVINDHAERRIKLMQDYNRSLTKNEESFQNLLLNVEAGRKNLPDLKKTSLVKRYS